MLIGREANFIDYLQFKEFDREYRRLNSQFHSMGEGELLGPLIK